MVGLDKAAAAAGGISDLYGAPRGLGEKPAGTAAAGAAATPFAGVFTSMMQQTQELGKKASDAVTGLLSGQGVEVHDVMIAQQKADASFELAMQVRNKAVGAYQQLMGMQF